MGAGPGLSVVSDPIGVGFMQDPANELPRISIPRTRVNSPQPKPLSGGYSQRPEVFSESFLRLAQTPTQLPLTQRLLQQ